MVTRNGVNASAKKKKRLSQKQLHLRVIKRRNLENYAEMWAKSAYHSYVEKLR